MNTALLTRVSLMALTLAVTACGGGSSSSDVTTPSPPPPSPPPAGGPTLAEQVAAATATANTNADCAQALLGSFYWEVGDANGALVSGTIPTSNSTVTANTMLSIASASKWLYSSYVVQQRGGNLTATDIPYLNFTSGYSQFAAGPSSEIVTGICAQTETIQDCLNNNNSTQDPNSVGKFFYDGGHMEVHAGTVMGLGALTGTDASATILQNVDFGQDSPSSTTYLYTNPLMSGGVATTANYYTIFLRRILSGTLLMKNALGTNPVCTTPGLSGCNALNSPLTSEAWHYSMGHWVEDDPTVGDGAFSSAGAFGFYPWIDKTKTYYGVIARQQAAGTGDAEGFVSAQCGRLIRQAFVTGVTVTATTPTPTR